MVSNEYSEAVVEVLDILNYTKKEDLDKIPKKLLDFFEKIKSKTYKSNINHSKPLKEQELKPKTKALIAMLYRNYWCNVEQKKECEKILIDNSKRYQEILKEKYNTENLFENNKKEITEEINIVPFKNKNIILRIFDKIKNIFKK